MSLGVDGREIGVLKMSDEVGLGRLLESEDGSKEVKVRTSRQSSASQ